MALIISKYHISYGLGDDMICKGFLVSKFAANQDIIHHKPGVFIRYPVQSKSDGTIYDRDIWPYVKLNHDENGNVVRFVAANRSYWLVRVKTKNGTWYEKRGNSDEWHKMYEHQPGPDLFDRKGRGVWIRDGWRI